MKFNHGHRPAIKSQTVTSKSQVGKTVRAWDDDITVIIPWTQGRSTFQNHQKVVEEFCTRRGLDGTIVSGKTKTGYIWVWLAD